MVDLKPVNNDEADEPPVRTGHGAASLIPLINDEARLKHPQLGEPDDEMPVERPAQTPAPVRRDS